MELHDVFEGNLENSHQNSYMTRIIRMYGVGIIVCLLLLLGAYLRLYNISGYMTFLGDEGRDMLVVKRMIVDHKFTLLGPTASVGGFFLGPIYYYFMVPFVWAWRLDPTGAAVMVALFGIGTIYLLYKVGRDLFDVYVGLIAAALYTLSPVVIAYSRSSWNPNLVPFFSTLAIYLAWQAIAYKRYHVLFWMGVCMGVGLQLHYLFLFLFPVIGIWFLLYGRLRTLLRYYAAAVIGFVIGYGPFLAFEVRHGFPNTQSIIRFLAQGEGTALVLGTYYHTAVDVLMRLFGRLLFRLPQPEVWVDVAPWMQQVWLVGIKFSLLSSFALLIAYAMARISFPFTIPKHMKHTPVTRQSAVLLLLWCIVPVMLFGLYQKGIYDYYFGIFFAVPFILLAITLRVMMNQAIGKYIGVAMVVGLMYFNWEGRPFKSTPNNQLGQAKMIARAALDKTGGTPFNFALLANFNSDHAYRYFFEIWGNPPVTIERDAVDPERKTVTDQLIVICELPECKPLGHPLWEIAGFGRAEISGEWPVSFVKVQRLVPYTEQL